jgi:macrolide transport system ATP-binding/permease protein
VVKPTLLAAVAGRLEPESGSVGRRRGLRVGLLEQDVRFADPSASPRAIYTAALGERRAEAVPLVGLGLIAPWDLDRPVGALSVGQQRQLALALILARPPHLFLLDEPTNHLSLALATELEEALGGYPVRSWWRATTVGCGRAGRGRRSRCAL